MSIFDTPLTNPMAAAYKVHGVNAPKTVRWGPRQPYTNRMRFATLFHEWTPGGVRVNDVHSDLAANGYPASMPGGNYARSYCCGSSTSTQQGVWVCAWDGAGDVVFNAGGLTAPLISPGRREVTIGAGQVNEAFYVEIRSLPVSNIRVFYKPYEQYLPGGITMGFDPDYVTAMVRAQYNSIRFLNFLEPNVSLVEVEADRKPEGYFTESNVDGRQDSSLPNIDHYGCTFASIAEHANFFRLKRVAVQVTKQSWLDPDHTYAKAMVRYLLDHTTCDIEIERSNESWNPQFADRAWYEDKALNGIPAIGFAARTVGTNNDKAVQAMGHHNAALFAAAIEEAGSQANRIVRSVAWQATNFTTEFFRFLTNTGQLSDAPFTFEQASVSFYYANQLPGSRVHTVTGQSGTFLPRERVTDGSITATLGYQRGNKLFLEDNETLTGTVTGLSSGATATITASANCSAEIATWTPADFASYAQHDLDYRVFAAGFGLPATKQMASTRGAVLVPYEGGKHENPSQGTYTAPARAAILAWYASVNHAVHIFDLYARMRTLLDNHGHWYAENGEVDWSPWSSYQDGLDNDPCQLAIELAGTALLGGGGQPNQPPVLAQPPAQNWMSNTFVSLQLTATDHEDGAITSGYSCTGLPLGVTCSDGGLVSGTLAINAHQSSPYAPVATVRDSGGLIDTKSFGVIVVSGGGGGTPNRSPSLVRPPDMVAAVGQPFSFAFQYSDPDVGQSHTFAVTGLPPGLLASGPAIVGQVTPGTSPGQVFACTAQCTDNGTPPLSSTIQPFTITVVAGLDPPIGSPVRPVGVTRLDIEAILKEDYRP